jgi:hypothetical protein
MTAHPAKDYIYLGTGVYLMPTSDHIQNGSVYQITIQGNLDPQWSTWFNKMEICYDEENQITTITGPIADQAELRGILNKLWDLNKSLIAVHHFKDRI